MGQGARLNQIEMDRNNIFTMRMRTRFLCMISFQFLIIAMFLCLMTGYYPLAALFAMESVFQLFLWLDTDPLKK
jgi:hypothetical protein